jgi:hypothetical protein
MPLRTLTRRLLVGAATLAVGVTAVGVGTAGAADKTKPGKGTTTEYTLHVAALPVTNLCNADAVVLNGDLYIRTTTTPDKKGGGYTVQSTINGRDLIGSGLPSALDYVGEDREQSNAYYAPPPYPATFTDVHYTKLDPAGTASTEYLVIVLREVVAADGTVVPTIDRTYLACTQPTAGASRA